MDGVRKLIHQATWTDYCIVRQLVRNFLHSFFGDNNQVLFHSLERKTVLKCEKVFKSIVQECLKIFIILLSSLKMHKRYRNYKSLVKRSFIDITLPKFERFLVLNVCFKLNYKMMVFQICQF